MLISDLLDIVNLVLRQPIYSMQAKVLIFFSEGCQHAEGDYLHVFGGLGGIFLRVGHNKQLDFALFLPIVLKIVFQVLANSLSYEFKLGLLVQVS